MKQLFSLRRIVLLSVLVSVLLISNISVKQHVSPVFWLWWGEVSASDGIAIKGFDPVTFFELQKAELGSEEFQYRWQGVRWYFGSEAHKQLFVKAPERYAPQFGGYCASGVSYGVTARSDPEAWFIQKEKLYLFGSKKVRQSWLNKIESGVIERAEFFWNL